LRGIFAHFKPAQVAFQIEFAVVFITLGKGKDHPSHVNAMLMCGGDPAGKGREKHKKPLSGNQNTFQAQLVVLSPSESNKSHIA